MVELAKPEPDIDVLLPWNFSSTNNIAPWVHGADTLLQGGNVFTVDELLDIANSTNRKIAELAKIHRKQLVQK